MPTYIPFGSVSFVTTGPAVIRHPGPIVTPGRTITPAAAPNQHPSPIRTPADLTTSDIEYHHLHTAPQRAADTTISVGGLPDNVVSYVPQDQLLELAEIWIWCAKSEYQSCCGWDATSSRAGAHDVQPLRCAYRVRCLADFTRTPIGCRQA